MGLKWLLILIGHLYLSAMWFGMAPRTGTKTKCLKEIGLCAPNMITILGSIVNIFGGTYMTSLQARKSYTLMMNKISYEL